MTLHDFDGVINKGAFNEEGTLDFICFLLDYTMLDTQYPILALRNIIANIEGKSKAQFYNPQLTVNW